MQTTYSCEYVTLMKTRQKINHKKYARTQDFSDPHFAI